MLETVPEEAQLTLHLCPVTSHAGPDHCTTQTNNERRFTLPNRTSETSTKYRRLLNFLEPGIFSFSALNTLLPTQSLQRKNTLEAMSSATERWAADPAVREILTREAIDCLLTAGVIPRLTSAMR